MKLLVSSLLIFHTVQAAVPVGNALGRSLKNAMPRNLETCESVGDVANSFFQDQFGDALGSDAVKCEAQAVPSLGCIVSCTSIHFCCNDFCGRLSQSFLYDEDLLPSSEQSCIDYGEHDSHELGGLTRCVELEYCEDGDQGKPCSCNAKVSGLSCGDCNVCDETVPGTDLPFAVADCSNIGGDTLLEGQCSNLETGSELLDLSLQCENPTLPAGASIIIDVPTEDDEPSDVAASDGDEDEASDVDVNDKDTVDNPSDAVEEPNDETQSALEKEDDPSYQACNGTATYYLINAVDYNPTCNCRKPKGADYYELHCQDDCHACHEDQCYIYSFTDFFGENGRKIAWERCDGDICEFKYHESEDRCFHINGKACVCSGLCDVDCSAVQEGFVFDKCTAEGNFGNFTDYFSNFYRSVYLMEEELTSGTCMSATDSINAGVVAGSVIGGLGAIVALACFIIFFRRRRAAQNKVMKPISEETEMKSNSDETSTAEKSSKNSEYNEPEKSFVSMKPDSDQTSTAERSSKSSEYNEPEKAFIPVEQPPEKTSELSRPRQPSQPGQPFVFDTDDESGSEWEA